MRPGYAGICITSCWYHTSLVILGPGPPTGSGSQGPDVLCKIEYSTLYDGHVFCPLPGPDGKPSQGNMDRMSGKQNKTPVIWRNTERTLDEQLVAVFPLPDVDSAIEAVLRFAYEFDESPESYHILTRNCRTFVARALVEACRIPPAEVHAAFAGAEARIGVCSIGAYCPRDCPGRNTRPAPGLGEWASYLMHGIFKGDALALLERGSQFLRWINKTEANPFRIGAGQDADTRPPPDTRELVLAISEFACAYSAPAKKRSRVREAAEEAQPEEEETQSPSVTKKLARKAAVHVAKKAAVAGAKAVGKAIIAGM